jgi:hypothetical protein
MLVHLPGGVFVDPTEVIGAVEYVRHNNTLCKSELVVELLLKSPHTAIIQIVLTDALTTKNILARLGIPVEDMT